MPAARGSVFLNILIVAAILFAAALLAGISYEQFERARDQDRLPPIGGDRRLNIFCSGEGQPAVILPAVAIGPSPNRETFGKKVSRVRLQLGPDPAPNRQIRPLLPVRSRGLGMERRRPVSAHQRAQARDPQALLTAARVPPPYVLVAASSAALDAHVYAGFDPSEVAGLVLADGVHPDFFARNRPGGGRFERVPKFIGHSQDISAQLFDQIGLYRVLLRNPPPPGLPPQRLTSAEWTTIWRLTQSPKARTALLQEIASLAQSVSEARAAGTLGNRPLIVISSENAIASSQDHDVWQDLQEDLRGLSSRGLLIRVNQSRGDLIYQAPDAIVSAARKVVDEVNATAASSPAGPPRP